MKKGVLLFLFLFSAGNLAAIERFSLHRDSYWMFWSGAGDKTLPLQFSGKYKAVDLFSQGPEGSGVYLAYTTRIFWDMYNSRASWPIYDVNHMPEGFLRWETQGWGRDLGLKWIELGYRHQSNGGAAVPDPQDPGDIFTKSYFQAFLNVQHEWTGEQLRLRTGLEGRAFHIDWENPDISDYIGRYALNLELDFRLFKKADNTYLLGNNTLFFSTDSSVFHELQSRHPQLSGASRMSFKAGLALDVQPLLRAIGADGSLSFFIQLHHGYGEYLSTYNDYRDNRVYVGVAMRPEHLWNK